MRIAVLMSTYNGEEYLEEQINSILEQKGNFQLCVWVRDDASADGTQEILQEYAKRGQLSWYTGGNLGPGKSFFDLIQNCRGYDYYAFADQDDYWMPDKIAAGITELEACGESAGLYCCNAEMIAADSKPLDRLIHKTPPRTDFRTFVCTGGLPGCTMLFNARLAALIQDREMPKIRFIHDFYIAAVCLATGGTIQYDSKPRMKYRRHGDNVTKIPTGVLETLQQRKRCITNRTCWSIADQANAILEDYPDRISQDNKRWLRNVGNYRASFSSRVRLGCSAQVHYSNINKSITTRMSIIFGNK